MELDIRNVDPKAPVILFETQEGKTITPKGDWPLRWFLTGGQMITSTQVTKGHTPGQPVHEWALQRFDLNGNVSRLADSFIRR